MIDIFNAVRGISCIEAAARLGWPLKRHGNRAWARCPFHDERTASLCLYEGDRGFYCYGCHEGGDAVRLYSKALTLEPLDAARQLASDFGIAADEQFTPQARKPTVYDIRNALIKNKNDRYGKLAEVSRACDAILNDLSRHARTLEEMDVLWDNPRFRQALMARTRANEELDQLETMTLHELADYFREVNRDIPRRRSEGASENAG